MLNATSYDSKSNKSYGYSISGPKADPDAADTSVRAACIEYRCPTSDPVRVDVRINPSICTYNRFLNFSTIIIIKVYRHFKPFFNNYLFLYCSRTRDLRVTSTNNDFQVLIEQGNLYGPANGIYVANGVDSARTLAKNWCIAGSSYYETGFQANPSKQPLIVYNCSLFGTPFG